MRTSRQKQGGLLIAGIVAVGLALAGVSIVTDGPESLSLRRTPDMPAQGSTSSRTAASNARGQYIKEPNKGLPDDQRQGTAWTDVPAPPLVVPHVTYADGRPVPQEEVPDVLGYEGHTVHRAHPGGAGSGEEAPLTKLREPIRAEEFWSGMTGPEGSPADVAPIPGQSR